MKDEKGAVRTCRRIEHGFVKVEDWFLLLAMLVLTGSIVIQIVCRYVLKISAPWCEELARYLFIAMTFVGSGRAFATGGHINIDLVDTVVDKKSKNPAKTMAYFNKQAVVVTSVFLGMFTVFYFQYLVSIAKHPQTSSSMHINMLIPMSTILIGSILMLYHNVCRLFYKYDKAPETSQAEN